MKRCTTAAEVIDQFPSNAAFARWWSPNIDRRAVWTWRKSGFPAATYIEMSERLRREHKILAEPTAWNMRFAQAAE